MDEMDILVLSVDKTDTKTDKGDAIRGVSVLYTFNTELRPEVNNQNSFGQKSAKVWADISCFGQFVNVPGLYRAKFTMKVGADGKPVVKPYDFTYKGAGIFVPTPVDSDADKVRDYAAKLANDHKSKVG